MEHLLRRLETLEVRSRRDHSHLLSVIGGQRERFEKAFDEMKLAWLGQEVALRQYAQQSRDQHSELREMVQDLAREVDERLSRLEGDGPPAA